jgi:hypothetical protein
MKTPLSNGPDMNPAAPLSSGPDANPLSSGPDKKVLSGPDPRGTGCKGTAAKEAVLSKAAAGSCTSPARETLRLPVLAEDALALTEAPDMDRKVVSPKLLLGRCSPAAAAAAAARSSAASWRKEPLRVSESMTLESSVYRSELEGVMAGESAAAPGRT